MDSNRDAAAAGSSRRVRSWDAPVLVALASVLVALVYNVVQIGNSANQLDQGQTTLKQGQQTLELSNTAQTLATFLQMHDRIVRAGAETFTAADTLDKKGFTDANQIRLLNAITPLEGVVFALENGVLPDETGELWARYLACDYQLANEAIGNGFDLAGWIPSLADFADRNPVDEESCPVH